MFDILRPYMDDAIRNANMLEEINTGRTPSKSAPGTMVHYLIRTLKPYLWSDDNPSVGKKRLIWKTKCVSKEKLLALSAFSSRQRVWLSTYLYVGSSTCKPSSWHKVQYYGIALYLRTNLVRNFIFTNKLAARISCSQTNHGQFTRQIVSQFQNPEAIRQLYLLSVSATSVLIFSK